MADLNLIWARQIEPLVLSQRTAGLYHVKKLLKPQSAKSQLKVCPPS